MTRATSTARRIAGVCALLAGAGLAGLAALPAPRVAVLRLEESHDCKPRAPLEISLSGWSAQSTDALVLRAAVRQRVPVSALEWRVEAPQAVEAMIRENGAASADESRTLEVELRSSAPPPAGQVDLVVRATLPGGEVVEARRSLRWGTPAPEWVERRFVAADGHEQVLAVVPAMHREGP